MDTDPRRVIVIDSRCHACSVHTVHVHHEHFPELRFEDISAEHAAKRLVNRLESARGAAPDSLHRETVQQVIDDIRAFLDREGPPHPGRDVQTQPIQS